MVRRYLFMEWLAPQFLTRLVVHTRKEPLPLYLLGLSAPKDVQRRLLLELLEWKQ